MAGNSFSRYQRQARFAPLGTSGQAELAKAKVLVCGCGALGTVAADLLVRAGVGTVRIVDRDFVEVSNLHRQTLFTEQDALEQLPKAVAAANRLRQVNSEVRIEEHVADLNAANIERLAADADVLVDGTDNFETRFLINDFAVREGTPWVFAGCVGAEGQSLAIVPGETPCLACFLPEPPPASSLPTCESAGVLGPTVGVIASYQAMEALKLCSGNRRALNPQLAVFDLWQNQLRSVAMHAARRPDCTVCGERHFRWLSGEAGSSATRLCGRNSVQLAPRQAESLDLDALAGRLEPLGAVTRNAYLLRAQIGEFQITVFRDGRAIIGGTDDEAMARTVHAKYVGS